MMHPKFLILLFKGNTFEKLCKYKKYFWLFEPGSLKWGIVLSGPNLNTRLFDDACMGKMSNDTWQVRMNA